MYKGEHMTIEDSDLFTTCTYKDHPHHIDGTFKVPRISNKLAEILAGDYDLMDFKSYVTSTKTNGLTEPMINYREKAEFIFGLSTLYHAMQKIGWVEHTSDWDWYVQIETVDGKWYGEDCQDGELKDFDYFDGQDTPYCDDFRPRYNEDTYMNVVQEAETYYASLQVDIMTQIGEKEVKETLTVGQIKRIIISER